MFLKERRVGGGGGGVFFLLLVEAVFCMFKLMSVFALESELESMFKSVFVGPGNMF